ncbi:uncharacterized protein AC631_03709 [Debaryomyces fabryi]|uniref:CobW/HypB/UreG nucleotide-binding domain-containing protein n=1 Tax=Debaryomyces fabryi TaxID=58627 RepID=A0A0V1PW84_9ASCO|nr:uncharacterized protein AC631_03709 [Debaryomyces fabryi]KSA00523.1 hypothetical protein AC631_03709 [Debaryomyces fabryi]CUM55185.1 unnamed protein product [Debaryomyces fabryi]
MDDIPDLVEELPEDFKEISGGSSNNKLEEVGKIPSPPARQIEELEITDEKKKIPITIITGYLGSGKSTLLEMIGKSSKKRLAIILNEFGDSSAIEKAITVKDAEKNESVQEWLDLGNGCLCCTVKDNGVLAIEQLIENSRGKIDYILLETTGVADPAPIAKMFWIDEGLSSNVYIDGVVTVLDAQNILKCLDDVGGHWHRENKHLKVSQSVNADDLTEEEIEDERKKLEEGLTTAHLQIALADTILINKVDTLQDESYDEKIQAIVDKIKGINSSTPIHTTSFGDIDVDKILDLHAFEANTEKLTQSINYMNNSTYHDDRIATVTITFPFFENNEFNKIESFIQYVLWENTANHNPIEIHRIKGILVNRSGNEDFDVRVIQGVRETYDIIEGGRLVDGITQNKLVFIGKNLNYDDLYSELQNYLQK